MYLTPFIIVKQYRNLENFSIKYFDVYFVIKLRYINFIFVIYKSKINTMKLRQYNKHKYNQII